MLLGGIPDFTPVKQYCESCSSVNPNLCVGLDIVVLANLNLQSFLGLPVASSVGEKEANPPPVVETRIRRRIQS